MSKFSTFLKTVLLLVLLDLGAASNAKVFRCPCSFSVARKVDLTLATNDEAFDVLVEIFASPRSNFEEKGGEIIEKHSSRNLRVNDATHSDSTFSYFEKMDITDNGLFRVRIRHQSTKAEDAVPEYTLKLHESTKLVICPVVLEPDMPSERVVETTSVRDATNLNETNRQDKIEGGVFAAGSLIPYLVSIAIPCRSGKPDCFQSCTGTLISPKWVMTAAHCKVPTGARVYISSRERMAGFSVRVNRTIPNLVYFSGIEFVLPSRQNQFDIAVIELKKSVEGCCSPKPRFMSVSLGRAIPKPGAFVRAAGYGRVSDSLFASLDPTDGLVRQVDLPIVRNRVCKRQYIDRTSDTVSPRRQVCAGYFRDGGCDSCFGDSGGPLVQYDGDTPVLMGITSFGFGCGVPGFPGVYTRPSGHKRWLRSTGAVFTEHSGSIDEKVVRCKRGEVLPYIAGEVSTCKKCKRTRFSFGGPARECRKCGPTLWRDTKNGAKCSCRARKGFGIRKGRCERCGPGFASGVGRNKCMMCKAGTFSAGFGRGKCARCAGALPGATRCRSRSA